jgi:hypothetical protein
MTKRLADFHGNSVDLSQESGSILKVKITGLADWQGAALGRLLENRPANSSLFWC